MILIYIDESGDTGTNFNDPQQPVFLLGALFVPQEKWRNIEDDFHDVVKRHFDASVPDNFELHTMHLVNRKEFF